MGEPVLLLINVRAQQVGREAIVHKVCMYLSRQLNTTEIISIVLIQTTKTLLQHALVSRFAAVCVPECENDGVCIAPGHCRCTPEWEGDRCERGGL